MADPRFAPIAIVGRACVLPGALTPDALWRACADGRDLVTDVPADRWRMTPRDALGTTAAADDRTWSARGGYVRGFNDVFDPTGFAVDAELVKRIDPLAQWLLHTGRAALKDAGVTDVSRAGAIVGNLSFPSSGMARHAERVWLGDALAAAANVPTATAHDRFMSGFPAHLLARALGLGAAAYAIDAACASSLYAIKLACDALHDNDADVMLAGAVNRADDLFLHIGFCALKALSTSGRSRPFHRDADGLLPASGAGIVVLKRLADAVAAGDTIHGVIRGIGLSNDGRGKGFLAPAQQGQRRAVAAAYEMADLSPSDVGLLECHATGTSVGDSTELRSTGDVFKDCKDVPIGSLKSNLGHLITTAGVAGLIKVLEAMRHGVRPATLHADDTVAALADSPFRVLKAAEPWPAEPMRRAGVSAFGFGGNNAHLIVEQYTPPAAGKRKRSAPQTKPTTTRPAPTVAIVGVGTLVGNGRAKADFLARLRDPAAGYSGRATEVALTLDGLRFPPRDLQETLPQQLMVLAAAREAVAEVAELPTDTTGVLIGMGCDPEVARYGARWRMAGWATELGVDDAGWLKAARDAIVPVLGSASVLGTMPNIPANRLNSQFDLCGPSLAVSAEELSGVRALQLAIGQLQRGELDAAIVGAVDLSCEPVHQSARAEVGLQGPEGDAAVVLVLKRVADAVAAGDTIYATLLPDDATVPDKRRIDEDALATRFGHPHAAWGLLNITANVLLLANASDEATITTAGMLGQTARVRVKGPEKPVESRAPFSDASARKLFVAAHGPTITLPDLPPISRPVPPLQPPKAQTMPRAPALPPILADLTYDTADTADTAETAATPATPALPTARTIPTAPAITPPTAPTMTTRTTSSPAAGMTTAHAYTVAHHAQLAELHERFVATQTELHRRFLAVRAASAQTLLDVYAHGAGPHSLPMTARLAAPPPTTPPRLQPTIDMRPRAAQPPVAPAPMHQNAELPGPKLDRAALTVHASGRISTIYGPLFTRQDEYEKQVRMPEPPLLLADRVTGIDAEPGTMGKGTIWTETDVTNDSWYLHNGRMPAGVMIEAGQADLMLISWLGIDFINKGERVYRLLGCDLTYHGDLPRPSDTLRYDIHCDGHAKQGDIGLFFFHYDCHIGDGVRLSVREGQAGFFSAADLKASKGILWSPETGECTANARLDAPERLTTKRAFTASDLQAWSEGDAFTCFGEGFERAASHTRTPSISGDRMLFLDKIDVFDPAGGPWGRGYLKATDTITPDDWFFAGHFKNDPCMPGTLMFEGCLQTMAVYLGALGYTIERDAWRFVPVPDVAYPLRCRGQVLPHNKLLTYEVFVDGIEDGPYPTLWADVLCTIDGLKAFHCRRLGVRLVPDWPLQDDSWVQTARPALAWPKIIAQQAADEVAASRQIAVADGFKFGIESLMACAWGKPSDAFGPMYQVFDDTRRVARLPGPPYHFMSRVASIEGDIGACQPGAIIELHYDIPPNAWYFSDNGAATMPFCVFLEAALQPCGWLASFVGSALTTDQDLFFRNLDGTATWHRELLPDAGTLITRVKITNISKSAGMVIESFEVQCRLANTGTTAGDDLVYEMNTVFGFFPAAALAAQKGLAISADQQTSIDAPVDVRGVATELLTDNGAVDLSIRTAPWFTNSARLPLPYLLMIDRVTTAIADGGPAGLGRYRAEKSVDPHEWFFKAHFFQDPVQPGSLGIEAMVQLLQFAMLHQGMAHGIEGGRFEPLALGKALTWRYRGQVRPHNQTIGCTVDIVEKGRDEDGPYAIATASLWVDGLRIYEASNLGMRIVARPTPVPLPPDEGAKTTGNPASSQPVVALGGKQHIATVRPTDTWLSDHRPTFTVPAVPLMVMVDWVAQAGAQSGKHVVELRDVAVKRWLAITDTTTIYAKVEPPEPDNTDRGLSGATVCEVELGTDAGVFATGQVVLADGFSESPEPLAAADGDLVEDPYAAGHLFHGPSLQALRSLRVAPKGASAVLDATVSAQGTQVDGGVLAGGLLNPRLLDGATHAIPHDRLTLWGLGAADDKVAYPARIERLRLYGPTPTTGDVRCEVRYAGAIGDKLARFDIELGADAGVWCSLRLLEALFEKGPLGRAAAPDRRAFLRDKTALAHVGLSRTEAGVTVLDARDVQASNWLAGTIEAVYGTADPGQIAVKEHVGRLVGVHPGGVPMTTPLNRFPVAASRDNTVITIRNDGAETLDLSPIRAFWDRWFGIGRWPVQDIYYGVMQRFLRRVVLTDPTALGAIVGRSALYCANHQTGVESLVFSILASGLTQVPTVTLAKAEHRHTWLGKLIEHSFAWPGVADPRIIAFFDRDDRASLPRIIGELRDEMGTTGRSVMVHVEGTRALHCRTPVQKMSSAFIDMALQVDAPVVPVRFVGGLPVAPLTERIEFPVGMGTQDIWIGRPIAASELAGLPLKERKQVVIDAINALGPSNADEVPNPPNQRFADKVAKWMAATGADEPHATLLCTLAELDEPPTDAITRLLAARKSGALALDDTPADRWLETLARRLFGPDGPMARA